MKARNPRTSAAPLTAEGRLEVERGFEIAYRIYGSGKRTLAPGIARRPRSRSEVPHQAERGYRRRHSARPLRPARRRRIRLARRSLAVAGPAFRAGARDRAQRARSRAGHALRAVMGGMLALAYTLDHPSRVSALILSNTYACGKDYLLDISDHRVSLGREMHAATLKHENAGTLDAPEYKDAVAELYARYLYRSSPYDWPAHARSSSRSRPSTCRKPGRPTTLGPARVHGHWS